MAHGFSATTYEWEDMARYLHEHESGKILYSLVLLGGHGRSYADFKASNWHRWGAPILNEYLALKHLGFTHINLAGSSTACALILEQLAHNDYSQETVLKNVFLIDPIVEPMGFTLRNTLWAGSFIGGYAGPSQAFTPEKFSHWYANRPFTAFNSLNKLAAKVEHELFHGIVLPGGTNLYVWASQGDPTVNPKGYLLIQKGVHGTDGGQVHATPIHSALHVFTRLSGRPLATPEDLLDIRPVSERVVDSPMPITPADRDNQKAVFEQMISAMRSSSTH